MLQVNREYARSRTQRPLSEIQKRSHTFSPVDRSVLQSVAANITPYTVSFIASVGWVRAANLMSSSVVAAPAGSSDDWRQIRAQRYKAEQQAAQAAPASQKLRSAVASNLSRLNSSPTWRRAAAAVCLALLAIVLRRQILNRFTLNQNDWQPDAWARPAHDHRAHVMSKRERSSSCCGCGCCS